MTTTNGASVPSPGLSLDLKGKIAFVTGGGRGIGLAITQQLAKAGATVVITWNSRDATPVAEQVSAETGSKVHAYHCPGEQSAAVNAVVDRVAGEVGEVDFVVCNAGVCKHQDTVDMTDDDLTFVMANNLFAPLYLSRAFVRHWLGLKTAVTQQDTYPPRPEYRTLDKKIIFISSISGVVSMTPQNQVSYNSSKAGLTMAAKSLAGEWAQYGIAVNALSPGYVSTDMTSCDPAWMQKWSDMTPFGRFAQPAELGNMVVLMCSGLASRFLTGHDLVMDGGYTVY
ncbi:hypothetical protein Q8F55_001502 [Vanrija albida]|uniref:Uncharacterized protein n=1 Tax=Vanrija albida TaxID=181172 RepID=A0ABR3QGD8_9TREE